MYTIRRQKQNADLKDELSNLTNRLNRTNTSSSQVKPITTKRPQTATLR